MIGVEYRLREAPLDCSREIRVRAEPLFTLEALRVIAVLLPVEERLPAPEASAIDRLEVPTFPLLNDLAEEREVVPPEFRNVVFPALSRAFA